MTIAARSDGQNPQRRENTQKKSAKQTNKIFKLIRDMKVQYFIKNIAEKKQQFPPLEEARGGSLSRLCFQHQDRKHWSAPEKKKRIPVTGWKKCLSGNPSCLSLVSYIPTPLSYTHPLPLTAYTAVLFHNPPEIIPNITTQEDMSSPLTFLSELWQYSRGSSAHKFTLGK